MESYQSAIAKIPTALKNIGLEDQTGKIVHNYTVNLLLAILQDDGLLLRLQNGELNNVLEEIKNI